MTREEREAFIRAEAQKRLEVRMAKLGLVSPSSGSGSPSLLDSAVEDRLAKEKVEAEEKARQAEKEMEERERARKARLASERGAVEEKPASPAPPMPAPALVVAPAAPTPPAPAIRRGPAPPPPMSKKKPAPPPPASRASAIRSPAPSPIPPAPKPPTPIAAPAPPPPQVVDPEEEAIKAREEELRKRREAQKARMLALEKEEEEARLEQERFETRRRALQEQKNVTASPRPPAAPPAIVTSPPVSVPPPPPPPPAEVTTPSSTNPFRLGQGQGAAATPTVQTAGGSNPFFRSAQPPAPPVVVQRSPTPPITSLPAPQRHAEALAPSKPSIYNKPSSPDSDNESGWGEEKDEDEDSSDDDRTARQKLAQHLFGTVMPARPVSAGSVGGAQSAPRTPPATDLGIPSPGPTIVAPIPAAPPPPPPPMPPAPPSVYLPPPAAAPTAPPSDDRNALLTSIMSGARLRPTKTIDKSVVQGAGAVLGDAAPPVHIFVAPRPMSPPAAVQPITPQPPTNGHAYKESVDWYAGLATEVNQKASAPTLPPLGEELAVAAPVINVSSEDTDFVPIEEDSNPLEDVDLGTSELNHCSSEGLLMILWW